MTLRLAKRHADAPFERKTKIFPLRAARVLGMAAIAFSLLCSAVSAYADDYWAHWTKADAAVAAGKPAEAVPHWEFLVNYYAGRGEWNNAAIFAGKLDEYFDVAKQYEQAIKYYEMENQFWLKEGKDWGSNDIIRADQLRTVVDAYVASGDVDAIKRRAAPADGSLAKFEPEFGIYLGLYSEQDPKMGNYFSRSESIFGKKHAIYLAYAQLGKPFPKQYVIRAKEAGAAIQIALEPIDGLDAVKADEVRAWAKEAKAAGLPIFLRYASEMNGDWVKWHGDPAKYIQSFQMVHDIMAQEAPNVAMVWSPNEVPVYASDAYYPGDAYVDWVGVSLYTSPYVNGDPKQGDQQGASPVDRLNYLYTKYADRKPLMISEGAVAHYSYIAGQSVEEYGLMNLQRLYAIMPYKYPRLKAITYFNSNLEKSQFGVNYLLGDNAAMQSLYRKLIAPGYYLTQVSGGAKPVDGSGMVPLETQPAFTKKTSITPYLKIPDVYIGKVDYALNGRIVASQTAPPYGLELKAGDVPEGSVLEIAVYNRSGQRAGTKSFALSSQVSVQLNGKDLSFEQLPVIRDGSTLTPLRAIFEALGAAVSWDPATRTATAVKDGRTVSVTIGSRTAKRSGSDVELEVPAQLVNGYTMVPARFVSEAFGSQVSWDGVSRTVSIRTDGQAASSGQSAMGSAAGTVKMASAASELTENQGELLRRPGLAGWIERQWARLASWWGGRF